MSNYYGLAAGHNNAAGLVNLKTLVVSGIPFPPVQANEFASPGQLVERADGSVTFDGRPAVEWLLMAVDPVIYAYIRTTWCAGGYSGLVTVRTTLDGTIYANYNARLRVPVPTDLRMGDGAGWFDEVSLSFIRMEAI